MGFLVALQFLTILPSPFRQAARPDGLARSQAYFPLVGLLIGSVLVALDLVLQSLLPPAPVNALLLLALVVLPGGVHLDGLIDSCDGLFVARTREERLAIMRDSRAGSFGIAGASVALITKFAALSALAGPSRATALLLAPTLARWAMVLALTVFPYARTSGKGSAFQGAGRWPFAVATLLALLLAAALSPDRGIFLFVAVAVFTALAGHFVASRLGGLTGDSYGMVNELAEILVLLGSTVVWRGWL